MDDKNNSQELECYQEYYSQNKFWAKLRSLGRIAGEKIIYNSLLLYYVLKSPEVPLKHKGLILGALGYLIMPADLIPDAIPMLGFTDDLSALYFVIKTVDNSITPAIRKQAEIKTKEIMNRK